MHKICVYICIDIDSFLQTKLYLTLVLYNIYDNDFNFVFRSEDMKYTRCNSHIFRINSVKSADKISIFQLGILLDKLKNKIKKSYILLNIISGSK